MNCKENNSFYPIMLNLKDKKIVIIGAGNIALRKLQKLIEYDGHLTVVSPEIMKEFYNFKGKINIIKDK